MAIEEHTFEKTNHLDDTVYENCQFNYCNFEKKNFNNYKFIDCTFNSCNLSLTQTENTSIQDCTFKNSKLLGIQFHQANTFNLSFSFDNCILDHSSFHGLKIKKTVFKDCSLKEVDFEQADCKQAIFANCNLERTVFFRSNLEQIDFSSAYNFVLDPEVNNIKGAKFSLQSLPGLLQKYKIKITD